MMLAIFFGIISYFGIKEFSIYLKEYFHFRKTGIRAKGTVVDEFIGTSNVLPCKTSIMGLPIIEVILNENKVIFKTFENHCSPLTTFVNHRSEVKILVDLENTEYCMVDWKRPLVVGLLLNIGFLAGFIFSIVDHFRQF